MTLSDIASIGSLVSGVAVLLSLIYLGIQTRQNVRHSQALIQQGRAARISDTSLRLTELRADDGINKCFEGSPDVSQQDVARFLFLCRSIFVSAEDSYFQHKQGLLDDMVFASFESSVKNGMGARGLAAGWILTANMYEPEFREYMNRINGDIHNPDSVSSRGLAAWKSTIASLDGAIR
jgi:hypothetical protein